MRSLSSRRSSLPVLSAKVLRYFLTVLLATASIHGAAAAQSDTPSLTPEAQLAYEKAMVAVQVQDWRLSIKYFLEAGDKNRDANGQLPAPPKLLFNLGLAYARSGDQLTAMALLQAYLAANPKAPNALQVRTEIARLEAAVEVKIRSLLQIYSGFLRVQDRSHFAYPTWVVLLAESHALSGNIDEAWKSLRAFNVDPVLVVDATGDKPLLARDRVSMAYATYQGFRRDLYGARQAMRAVARLQKVDAAWCNIAGFWGAHRFSAGVNSRFQLRGLDLAIARDAAQQMQDPSSRQKCLEFIEVGQGMKASLESRGLFRLPGRGDRGAGSPAHLWQQAAWGLWEQCDASDCDDLESTKGGFTSKEFRYPFVADYLSGGLLYVRALQKVTAEPAR